MSRQQVEEDDIIEMLQVAISSAVQLDGLYCVLCVEQSYNTRTPTAFSWAVSNVKVQVAVKMSRQATITLACIVYASTSSFGSHGLELAQTLGKTYGGSSRVLLGNKPVLYYFV